MLGEFPLQANIRKEGWIQLEELHFPFYPVSLSAPAHDVLGVLNFVGSFTEETLQSVAKQVKTHFNTCVSIDLNQMDNLPNLSEMWTKHVSLLLIVGPICERGMVFTADFRGEAKIEFIMENKFWP